MAPQPSPSPGTILLVDDDSTIVRSLSAILQHCGYEVLTAGTLEDAICAVRGAGVIDLLVVDAVMPGVSGPEVAEILLFLRPNLKILFITGLDGLAIRLAFDRPCSFLQKPFSVGLLLSTVQQLLCMEDPPAA
jgi:two-component system cell cycle sensor histidine kinase/response regulator CckA